MFFIYKMIKIPLKIAFCLLVWIVGMGFSSGKLYSQVIDSQKIPFADGFDLPVGKPNGENYYLSRGLKGRHLGEDWNGEGGGNTDLGDPIYSVAHGLVISASDIRMGYGKTVFIVHKFRENGKIRIVETLYSHMNSISVSRGDVVKRGQKVGTIGTGNGLYSAHLHFELRDKPGQFVRIGYRKGREFFLDGFNFISARRPKGSPDLILVQRPGNFPGRIPFPKLTVASDTRFLAENKGVPLPKAGVQSIDIDIVTPEDGRLASIKKSIMSSLPRLAQLTGKDKKGKSSPTDEQADQTFLADAGDVAPSVIDAKKVTAKQNKQVNAETQMAQAVAEKNISDELGNLPSGVAQKYAKLKEDDDDRVVHFEQHMANDSLDDPEMSEAALKTERILIAEALANRSKQGGLIEVNLDQLLLVDESITKTTNDSEPPREQTLSLMDNPLEIKAKKEISRAMGQVNNTAIRLALFLNELAQAQDDIQPVEISTREH